MIAAIGTTGFDVLGSHSYAAAGTFTVAVTLTALGSTNSTVVGGTSISVTAQARSCPLPVPSYPPPR